MTFHLRPFQDDILDQVRALLREGHKRILIQSPTRSGKTILAAAMLGNSARKGLRSWFVVHRRELIRQSSARFKTAGIPHSFVAANQDYDKRNNVFLCGVQTLVKRLNRVDKPNIIIWDECHHMAARTWEIIMETYPDEIHIGLSATPKRLDGKALRKYFTKLVKGPTPEWLIENGYRAKCKIYAPNPVSMAGVRTSMGDYAKSETQKRMDKRSITGDAIGHYLKLCRGAQFVVFCAGIEHSKHVAEQFTENGIPCIHVDGNTQDDERDEVIRKLESREIMGVSNVDLYGEGIDLPSLQCVILLNPTQSLTKYMQAASRGATPEENKPYYVILDHAGNSLIHGLPDDDFEWSLDGEEKTKGASKAEVNVKSCPECFAVVRNTVITCQCGHRFVPKERKVNVKEGELQEVDVEALRRNRLNEQREAASLEALTELGVRRGYKNPAAWAWNLTKARDMKRAKRKVRS